MFYGVVDIMFLQNEKCWLMYVEYYLPQDPSILGFVDRRVLLHLAGDIKLSTLNTILMCC